MKNLKFFVLAVLGLNIITACEDDPENFDILPENLLEITVGPDAFDQDEDVFVWLTASDGTILGEAKLENGQDTDIKAPEGFSADRFSYHVLYHEKSGGDFRLNTHANVKRGQINYKELYDDSGEAGEVELAFTDVPDHEEYIMHNGYGFYWGTQLHDGTYRVYDNTGWLYLWLNNFNNASYMFIEDVGPGQERTVSLSDMNDNMRQVNIDFGETGDMVANINAYGEHGNFYSRFTCVARTFGNDYMHSALEILIPDSHERFKDAGTNLYLYPEVSDTDYRFRTYGWIPESFQKIDASISLANFSENNLEVSTSGNFDMFCCYLTCYDEERNYLRWSFMNATSDDIRFPLIPSLVTSQYPGVVKDRIINSESRYTISVEDFDHLSSYDDYVDRIYIRTGKKFLDGIRKAREAHIYDTFSTIKSARDMDHQPRDNRPER